MLSAQSIASSVFFSGKGHLSIYGKGSFSRKPMIIGVPIKSSLKEDGSFSMSLVGKDFLFESSEARKELRNKFGIGFSSFTGSDFFNGTVMDELDFEKFNESVSTYIIGGELISLKKVRKTSFIGNFKMVDGFIYMASSFTLMSHGYSSTSLDCETNKKSFHSIEFEISSQSAYTAY
jgi:hypothetical protein